ncbi:MAG: phosphonate C-P lyase system protein PhnG [Holdemania massiliensis]
MKRKERTQILIHCPLDFLNLLKQKIESEHPVRIVEDPQLSLVMVKMRESAQSSLFYLTEMVVRSARQRWKEFWESEFCRKISWKSLCLAVIDAAYNASLKCCEQLTAMIREQGQLQQKQRIQENKQILKTRVSFETMDRNEENQ